MSIVELIGQLKRTFATIRLYGLAHENARIAEAQLFAALTSYLDTHGSLSLVVRASALEVGDKKVYEDERKEESLVRSLFVDGVESLTILAGVGKDELSTLVRAWHGAITHTLDAEHSFATLMWEHELPSVSASIRPGIADVGADTDSDAAKAAEGRLRQIYAALTAQTAADRVRVVEGASLAVVRAVLGDVSAEALARQAGEEEASGLGLSQVERQQLAQGLGTSQRGSGQRALFALSRLWARAEEPRARGTETDDARRDVGALVVRLLSELVASGRTGEIARATTRIEDPGLREYFGDPAFVAALVKDGGADAFAILGALPVSCIDALAEPFAQAGGEARSKLAALLADKSPTGETLATWLLAFGARVVVPLFELSDALEPAVREMLVRTALVHDEPEVVLRGLARVPAGALGDYRSLVEPRLSHSSAEVRRAALGAFVRAQDPAVPALLEAQLGDPGATLEWQKSCVHLLGTAGGPGAARVLVALVESTRPRELRVAATTALANVETPEARRIIEREAARLLGDRAVKRAAKEVLRRWEKRGASLPPRGGVA